jgi:hypothetical protein
MLYWGETATITFNLFGDNWCSPSFMWYNLNKANCAHPFTLPPDELSYTSNGNTATVTNIHVTYVTYDSYLCQISATVTTPSGSYGPVFLTTPGSIQLVNGYRPQINPCGQSTNSLDQFTVTDANGNNQSMFVLNGGRRFDPGSNAPPPESPEGVFSARFQSGKLIEKIPPTNVLTPIPIIMKSVTNPLTIRWNIKPENKITYFLSEGSGNEQSSISLSGSGSHVLSISKGGSIFIVAQAIYPPPCDLPPDDPLNTGISGQKSTGSIPGAYSLNECYPNPFNPTTKIDYALSQNSYVTLRVFNVLGQEVGKLVDEFQTAGYKSAEFDASRLPSGIYFYHLTAGSFVDIKKMMLMK